jgi:hypothetical protein
MLRSYRRIIFAAFIGLAVCSPGQSQSTGGGNKIAQEAKGGAKSQQNAAANAVATPGNNLNREESGQSECGTPKECRAEQRDKDDLIAQQSAAKAATDQASLARWQTLIATIGVIAIIATLIYTHMATRAAINSVSLITQIEGPRISMCVSPDLFRQTGTSAQFEFSIANAGRISAVLKESSIGVYSTKEFKNFTPSNVKKHNSTIPTGNIAVTLNHIDLFPIFGQKMLLQGYYEWTSALSEKPLRDYFSYAVIERHGGLGLEGAAGPDWPPDN